MSFYLTFRLAHCIIFSNLTYYCNLTCHNVISFAKFCLKSIFIYHCTGSFLFPSIKCGAPGAMPPPLTTTTNSNELILEHMNYIFLEIKDFELIVVFSFCYHQMFCFVLSLTSTTRPGVDNVKPKVHGSAAAGHALPIFCEIIMTTPNPTLNIFSRQQVANVQ